MPNTKNDRVKFNVAAAILALSYALILWILPPNVFWSPDEGGKFLQMCGWRAGGQSEYKVLYRGSIDDAEYRFYPKRAMYPQPHVDGTITFGWPPWFCFLSILQYRAFGLRSIYVLPALASIGTMIIAGLTARRLRSGSWPFVVFGTALASPMLFYGLLFWEHTAAACCGLAAVHLGVFSLQEGSVSSRCLKAGVMLCLLAFAVLLRFEMLILPLAMLGVAARGVVLQRLARREVRCLEVPRNSRWAPILALSLLAAVLTGAVGIHLGGHFRFPHYTTNMIRTALSTMVDAAFWRTIPKCAVDLLVNTSVESGMPLRRSVVWFGLFGAGLCVLSCAPLRRARFWLWIAGAVALGWVSWTAVTLPERYRSVHSLLLPAPFLLLSMLPLPRRTLAHPSMAHFEMLACLYLGLYIPLALLVGGVQGGAEWGNRYGLMVYPMLTIMAGVKCRALMSSPETGHVRRTALSLVACGMLVLGFLFSVRGVGEIQRTKSDLASLAGELQASGPVVVTNHWWMLASLGPALFDRALYTVSSPREFALWVERVGRRSERFEYASYGAGPSATALAGLGLRLEETRVVSGMNFFRYAVVRP